MFPISQISVKKRLLTIGLLITFLFTAVIAKLFYVQIIDGVGLQSKALDQWTRDVPIVAARGNIYSSDGSLLAGTTTSYTIYVRPASVESIADVARAIADATSQSYDALYRKIEKRGASELTVAKKVTKECVLAIMKTEVKGVYFSADTSRFYPYGDYMSAVLGFTNADTRGQTGLELYYDKYLVGVNGYELTQTDLIGKQLNGVTTYVPAVKGLNVSLTVESNVQYFAESAVKAALEKYGAKSASCIVMNAVTGGVTAIAQAPSFDLNAIPREDVTRLMELSTMISAGTVFEPGSTFKILTLAIAINEGLTGENDRFFCPGFRIVDGQRIKCWRSIGHGSQTLEEGVCNSCNCVFMDLALRIGVEKLYSYYRALGLNVRTGLDVNGETAGILLKEDTVKTVDLARIGFGQAIAVTPIGLISAVSAIINGGNKVTPHLLDEVKAEDGTLVYHNPEMTGANVISATTSEKVRKLLKSVVSDGSGKHAKVDGYSIGGKTGTAQKYENGTIARGKYLSSFIGFSTVENPEYVILFMVDEPQGYLYYGSLVAAPYVGEIFSKIFQYKEINPTEPMEPPVSVTMPDLIGKSLGEAVKELRSLNLIYELSGDDGTVTSQFPPPLSVITTDSVAYIELSVFAD